MPLLLLVQQVGGGGDTAQSTPRPHREQQRCSSPSIPLAPSYKERWWRAHESYTAATAHPLAVPEYHGDGALQWMGYREDAGDTEGHQRGPLSSSLVPGRRHGVLQDPALCSSGTCPQRAQSPRGVTGLARHGTSASSPARMCGSSPSSTSASWTPPTTRPSTGGTSAWMQWVSPCHQAVSL